MPEKRLITERQEQALKLCHHDLEGLTQTEAAERMGIIRRVVNRLLEAVKKALPDYFPILTKQEANVYHHYEKLGRTVNEIAESTDLSHETIYGTLRRARAKGMPFTKSKGRILRYHEGMDDEIVFKF